MKIIATLHSVSKYSYFNHTQFPHVCFFYNILFQKLKPCNTCMRNVLSRTGSNFFPKYSLSKFLGVYSTRPLDHVSYIPEGSLHNDVYTRHWCHHLPFHQLRRSPLHHHRHDMSPNEPLHRVKSSSHPHQFHHVQYGGFGHTCVGNHNFCMYLISLKKSVEIDEIFG